MTLCAKTPCRRRVMNEGQFCYHHGGRAEVAPNPSGLCMCGCGRVTPLARQTCGDVPKGQHHRFAGPGCYGRFRAGTTREAAFWAKVERTDDCWLWRGTRIPEGYGQIKWRGETSPAHRFGYELLVGPIPAGLELDHLCHTNDPTCAGGSACPHRACVNPDHLEPVTQYVNNMRSNSPTALNARRTRCVNGHELAGANLILRPSGGRYCRQCRHDQAAQRWQEEKAGRSA